MFKTKAYFETFNGRHVLLRMFYDIVLSILSLGFAFAARTFVYMVWEPGRLSDGLIVQDFQNHFLSFGYVLALTTVVSFGALGFYRLQHEKEKVWRPIVVIAGISLAVALFSMLMYFIAPRPLFSRGVVLFTWVFMIFFLGLPRLVKYFMFKRVVFETNGRKTMKPQNILVIGGAGYVGSPLVAELLNKGYRVRILDSLLFGDFSIKEVVKQSKCDLIVGDFRNVQVLVQAMRGMDAVVHLGGIVGDPACSLDDDFTIDVNLTATTLVAETCKLFNIHRFVFASTCSVYGQSGSDLLTEESPMSPVSLYAKTKIASEKVLKQQTSANFQPTILRFSTLFGLSARPRFDLVVNLLTAKALTEKKIHVFGGAQWRPFVHVKDTSRAIIAVIEAPLHKVGGEIFNVGSGNMNYQILDVGKKVAESIEGTELLVDNTKEDTRNYNVSFEKIENVLGLYLERDLDFGINEIKEAFKTGEIKSFLAPEYSNVIQTEKVLTNFVNHVEADVHAAVVSHHKKTPKTMLRDI